MFAVVFLHVCLAIGPCMSLTDDRGPFKSMNKCFDRIEVIIKEVAQAIGPRFAYAGICAEVNEDGIRIGPPKNYIPKSERSKEA